MIAVLEITGTALQNAQGNASQNLYCTAVTDCISKINNTEIYNTND